MCTFVGKRDSAVFFYDLNNMTQDIPKTMKSTARKLLVVLCLLVCMPATIAADSLETNIRDSINSISIDADDYEFKQLLRKPLQVRCGKNLPPFEFINEQGQPDGFNIDLVHAIMEEIDVPYELYLSDWKGVVDSLSNSLIDFVGGMTYSMERADKVYFGMSHALVKQMFIVKEGSPYRRAKDLYGKKVCMRSGGVAHELLTRYNMHIIPMPIKTTEATLDMLLEDKCDAVLLNDVAFEYIRDNYPKYHSLRAINSSLMPSEYRIACCKEYGEVLMPLVAEAMYNLRKSGEYDRIYQKWFGQTHSERMLEQVVWVLLAMCVFLFAAVSGVIVSQYRIKKAKDRIDKQKEKIMQQMQNIKDNELTLKKIVNMVSVPIFIVDVKDDFRVCFSNKYAAHTFKLSSGMKIEDFIDEESIYLMQNDYVNAARTGQKINVQHNLVLKDGCNHYINLFHEPIEFNGKSCILSLCMIVTDYKKVEKELREAKDNAELSEKQKSAFLADMSHEIRNPLNAIMGFAQLLDADYLDENDKAEFGHLIKDSSEQLMNLLNDILDFSKMEADMMELHPSEFDFAQYFNETCISYKMQTENAGLQFICESPYKECIVTNIDKTRIGQVFTNFFSNALKFTEKGSITLSYKYERGGIFISVTDTGIGIDKEKQKYLFERYKQLNTTKKGSGLGMAICKQIAVLSKGEIGFESEPGQGSCFHLWWPTPANVTE